MLKPDTVLVMCTFCNTWKSDSARQLLDFDHTSMLAGHRDKAGRGRTHQSHGHRLRRSPLFVSTQIFQVKSHNSFKGGLCSGKPPFWCSADKWHTSSASRQGISPVLGVICAFWFTAARTVLQKKSAEDTDVSQNSRVVYRNQTTPNQKCQAKYQHQIQSCWNKIMSIKMKTTNNKKIR